MPAHGITSEQIHEVAEAWRSLHPHLLQTGCHDMREFYNQSNMLPTSEVADIALIRSHVAYWAGRKAAERAEIRASRGHSYRLVSEYETFIVRIRDHYDHRDGVTGWRSEA